MRRSVTAEHNHDVRDLGRRASGQRWRRSGTGVLAVVVARSRAIWAVSWYSKPPVPGDGGDAALHIGNLTRDGEATVQAVTVRHTTRRAHPREERSDGNCKHVFLVLSAGRFGEAAAREE
jgi:hypothetical protein